MQLIKIANNINKYGLILILSLICVFTIGFFMIFQNIHMYYSRTYLQAESKLVETTINDVIESKPISGVVIRELSNNLVDRATGIDLSGVLSYKNLPWLVANPKGLFLTENSAKFIVAEGENLLFVEIPQSYFTKILTSELSIVMLANADGVIVISSDPSFAGMNIGTKSRFAKLNKITGYLHMEDFSIANAKGAVFIPMRSYLSVIFPYLMISFSALAGVVIWLFYFSRFTRKLIGATSLIVDNINKTATLASKGKDANYIPVKTNIEELNELQECFVRLIEMEKASQLEMQAMMNSLQDTVNELEETQKVLQERNLQIISTLAEAIEIKDTSTYGHSDRVVSLALELAKELNITDPADLEAVRFGALLHDVGKIGIPEHILNKPGRLTFEEFEIMKKHPIYGEKIIKNISGWDLVADVVRHHHENIDGSGYPDGLKDGEISIRAQIVSIVDVFAALIEERPYRPAMSVEEALRIMSQEMVGVKFDPKLYEAFLRVLKRSFKL